MLLIIEEGRFFDPAAVADCPDDAMLRTVREREEVEEAARLPHALALIAVLVGPLVPRGVVAGLHPWERQVRGDFLPESIENGNGHPICEIPSVSWNFASPNRLSDKHGDDWRWDGLGALLSGGLLLPDPLLLLLLAQFLTLPGLEGGFIFLALGHGGLLALA